MKILEAEDVLKMVKLPITIKDLKELKAQLIKNYCYIDITTNSLSRAIARNPKLKWLDDFTIGENNED